MTETFSATRPTDIELDTRGRRLRFVWADGRRSDYDWEYLRWRCPCATCSGEGEFAGELKVTGCDIDGFRVLRTSSPAVPNAIAAFMLYLRDTTGKLPHVYFGWSEGNPLKYLLKYIAFGEGDTAPTTHEVLRQVEDDPEQRPAVHVGG